MSKWGAIDKLVKITGEKPSALAKAICDVLEELHAHFSMYYRDVKNSVMELEYLKYKATSLESEVKSLKQQIEAMQATLNRHANMLNKLPVYGSEE